MYKVQLLNQIKTYQIQIKTKALQNLFYITNRK